MKISSDDAAEGESQSKVYDENEYDFTVDLALVKFGIDRIRVKQGAGKQSQKATCVIQYVKSDNKSDIIFDIDAGQRITTINNFYKEATDNKLNKGLIEAFTKYFIQKYFDIKESNSAIPYQLRPVWPDETIRPVWPRKPEGEYPDVTATQCAYMHQGNVRIVGSMINSINRVSKWISAVYVVCPQCRDMYRVIGIERPMSIREVKQTKDWGGCMRCGTKLVLRKDEQDLTKINIRKLELQDIDDTDSIEGLNVLFFDEDAKEARKHTGEQVIVTGSIFNIESSQKQLSTYVLADSVEYLNKKEIVDLDEDDIIEIKKFAADNRSTTEDDGKSVLGALTKMFATSIIGHEDVKKGLLLSAVNSGKDSVFVKKRINVLLIGDTGEAKTGLIMRACRLVQGSRFTSAQTSSAKGLIAVIDKTDNEIGEYTLRRGPVIKASGALCGVDEVGRMRMDDQGLLLSALQEGKIPFNRYGFDLMLDGSSTFIFSANPMNPTGKWGDDDFIRLAEIPLIGAARDRIDLVFIFRGSKDEDAISDYATTKMDLLDNIDATNELEDEHDRLIQRCIIYSKRFSPKLSDVSKEMIKAYFVSIRLAGHGSPRALESLMNLSIASAKLEQKDTVDESDVVVAINIYNKQLENMDSIVDARGLAVKEIIDAIRGMRCGYEFKELLRQAKAKNPSVDAYVGPDLSDNNWRYKTIRTIFTEHVPDKNVIIVSRKPLVLAWKPTYDASYAYYTSYSKQDDAAKDAKDVKDAAQPPPKLKKQGVEDYYNGLSDGLDNKHTPEQSDSGGILDGKPPSRPSLVTSDVWNCERCNNLCFDRRSEYKMHLAEQHGIDWNDQDIPKTPMGANN